MSDLIPTGCPGLTGIIFRLLGALLLLLLLLLLQPDLNIIQDAGLEKLHAALAIGFWYHSILKGNLPKASFIAWKRFCIKEERHSLFSVDVVERAFIIEESIYSG